MASPARSRSHSQHSPGSAASSNSASTSHPSLTFRQYKAEVRRVMTETANALTDQRREAMAKNAGPLAGQIQRRLILISSWVNAQTRAGRDRTYRDGADVGSANGYLSENLALVGNLFLHVPFEQNLKGLMPTRRELLAGEVAMLPYIQPLLRHIPHDEDAASTTTSPFRPGTRTSSSSRPSDFIASHQLDSNGRPRLDFVAWKETLGQGLAGALHLLQAPVPVDERLEGRWISLVRTRVDELGWYKQEVLDRTTAEDWGSPSSRLAAQRFENVSVLLNNATGWPLDKTFPTRHDLLEGIVRPWENVDTRAVDAFYRTLHFSSANLLQSLTAQKSAAENAGNALRARQLGERKTQVIQWLRHLDSFKSRRILMETPDAVVEGVMAEVGATVQRIRQQPIRHVLQLPDLDDLLHSCSPRPSASQSSPFSIQGRH
ncbi:hypothetical protein NBRC10512_001975 [Rhodotorula toruloides]|uniref:Uncharacterized protein n=1 Tax=Rhodotorula toruloides (strain NP11) TaxID=1130832 RepID=M7Y0J4_RHOT1|nr:uncharacterized protein RHTO_00526 [Rhodotorula toruloides NP11]EMS26098.1 hypothetical protein RHTO_00526 [Rhodotorula toruloides NP11]